MPTVGLGALIGGIAGAGGSIVSGALGSSAAGKAATTQAQAATYAADLAKQSSDKALAEQQRQFDISQGNLQPWLSAGQYGLSDLLRGMGLGREQATETTTPFRTSVNTVLPSAKQYEIQGQIPELEQKLAALTQARNDLVNDPIKPFFQEVQQRQQIKELENQISTVQNQLQSNQTELQQLINQQNATSQAANATAQTTQQTTTPTASTLSYGEFNQPFVYNPNEDPSTQFRFEQGQNALERSAAAKGMPFGGSAAKAAIQYGQNFGSQEYNNAYQRYQSEQANRFNRLAAIAGIGQTATSQANALGQNYANNYANILTNAANTQGDYATQAANARASGYANSANAWGNAISGGLNNLFGGISLYNLLKNQG